ncbi:MAG: PIG-L family deacetylase [Sandaracinaceae bacterium]|nr:PIG-L family deacetylase [Sandaracinaceae bacterium]
MRHVLALCMRPSVLAPCALLFAACGAWAPHAPATALEPSRPLWVLAPHPDDEALFGAEPIRRALREGRDVSVLVMTNGDLGCERDGHLRQRETVAAMAALGLAEDRIHFLGYPDGYLDALGEQPLPPRERRALDGSCGLGAGTYASRGAGHADVHTRRTGAPGPYTAAAAIDDLRALLEDEHPSDVYVAHPIDEHPDHATTYVLLRRALEVASIEPPRVHRALVHVGGCWPNGDRGREPCDAITGELGTPYPPLPAPLAAYAPNEHLVVDDGGAEARAAIAQYRSQLHVEVEHDWLGTFARGESIAWHETLVREGERVVRTRPHPDDGSAPPFEIALEATIPGSGGVELSIGAESEPVRVELTTHEITFAHGSTVLRRVFVPEVEGTHRWSLRVDPRSDDAVTELELRRDGSIAAYAIDLDQAPAPQARAAAREGARCTNPSMTPS